MSIIYYLISFTAHIEALVDIEKTTHPNFQYPDGRPLTWQQWWNGEPGTPTEMCAAILSRDGAQVCKKMFYIIL